MFIIRYHAENIQEEQDEKMLITDTIEGLFAQTDGDWNATLVVDGYSRSMVRNYLHYLKETYYPKIDIIFLDRIVGPGVARNLAVISQKYYTSLCSSALLAGPLITFPEEEKREPWHGQSNDFSELFQVTVQPK